MCCKGLESHIPPPRTKHDKESLVWQLHFHNTRFFIRSKRWYRLSMGDCRYLDENNRCTIYARRPDICREHNPPSCEYHGEIFDIMFETPEKLNRYFQRQERKKAQAKPGKNPAKGNA